MIHLFSEHILRTHRTILEQAGLASGLLTEEQISLAWQSIESSLPVGRVAFDEVTDQQLGEELVRLGFLNRWQSEQLCHGRTKFTLGPYNILDAIGHGGMGYVFKGEHILLGRIEAIKVLPKLMTDSGSIANFRREIRAQARLDHPNLVRLTYADTDGDTYFLVTEFVPGSDLRRLVRHHGPLSEQQAALIVHQTALALDHAHQQGLIHRDVKPGNLLITPAGLTKLTDLGLAYFASDASADSSKKPKHIVGTADFLAPEVVVNPREVREISDIYSLGCTLYYAVTGKVPFPGGDTADKLRRHLEETPIPPEKFNAELSKELRQLISAAMNKRPEGRVQSAAEVADRLQPWIEKSDEQVWQSLGRLTDLPADDSFYNAGFAETLPAVDGPQETHGREEDRTDRLSTSQTRSLYQGNSPVPSTATVEEDGQLSTTTKALVGLAVVAGVAVLGFVLWSLT